MFLIAIIGEVGSGKTALLGDIAGWFVSRGKVVEGFLQRAGTRSDPAKGADYYDLQFLATGKSIHFATRNESLSPPYEFHPSAQTLVEDWARGLRGHPVSLLILDEFGPLEAQGGGHMKVWTDVLAANPEIAVIAMRPSVVQSLQEHLGRTFDVVVDAARGDAHERLSVLCADHADWTIVGAYGAGAGAIEATLGSMLHGAQVPLRGLGLSGIQTAVLVSAGQSLRERTRVVWVSFIAAGLKALSPAGNRLRPMLAITMQGVLFGFGTNILGWNVAGILAGSMMVGAWAAAQGIVLQYLLIGSGLFSAYDAAVVWLREHLQLGIPGFVTLMAVWITLWGAVTAGVGLWVWRRRSLPVRLRKLMERGVGKLQLDRRPVSLGKAMAHGARDLLKPAFYVPVALVVAILLAAGSPWETGFWIVARAVTVGAVVFSLVRLVDVRAVVSWLRRRKRWGPAVALERAMPDTPTADPMEKSGEAKQ
jgi:nucleoside-triphosphatase THEP1